MGYANTLGQNYRIYMLMVRLWNCPMLRLSIPNEGGYLRSVKFVPSLRSHHVHQKFWIYFPPAFQVNTSVRVQEDVLSDQSI